MTVEGGRDYRERLANRTLQRKGFSTPAPKSKSLMRRAGGYLKQRYTPSNIASAAQKVAKDTLKGGEASVFGKELVSNKRAAKLYGSTGPVGAAMGVGANVLLGNFINNPDFEQASAPLDFVGITGLGKAAAKIAATKGVKPALAGLSGLDISGVLGGEEAQATRGKVIGEAGRYVFDPQRIKQAAQEISEIGEGVLRSQTFGDVLDLSALRKRGFTGDPRDIYTVQAYGIFDDLKNVDDQFIDLLSQRTPESVRMGWLSPEASAKKTFQTLRDPLRFPFTLSKENLGKVAAYRIREEQKKLTKELNRKIKKGEITQEDADELINAVPAKIKAEVESAAVPELAQSLGVTDTYTPFSRSRPRVTLGDEQAGIYSTRYNRLTDRLNPELILPRRFTSRLEGGIFDIPGSLQGEHNVFPAGGFTQAVENIFSNPRNLREGLYEQLAPLAETVQGDIGLNISKLLNQLLASGPRTVGGNIDINAPAFKAVLENYPILAQRNTDAGLLDFYADDLSRAMINAEDLTPKIIKEIEQLVRQLEGRRRLQPTNPWIL